MSNLAARVVGAILNIVQLFLREHAGHDPGVVFVVMQVLRMSRNSKSSDVFSYPYYNVGCLVKAKKSHIYPRTRFYVCLSQFDINPEIEKKICTCMIQFHILVLFQ